MGIRDLAGSQADTAARAILPGIEGQQSDRFKIRFSTLAHLAGVRRVSQLSYFFTEQLSERLNKRGWKLTRLDDNWMLLYQTPAPERVPELKAW